MVAGRRWQAFAHLEKTYEGIAEHAALKQPQHVGEPK
jgi:hypothetical protein